jgi:hypothetical protein
MRLQRLEQKLHLPPQCIDGLDILGRKLVAWEIGEVNMIASRFLIADGDQAEGAARLALMAKIGPALELDLHFDIKHPSVEPGEHILETLAYKLYALASPLTVDSHDQGVGIGLAPSEKEPSIAVDPVEEMV